MVDFETIKAEEIKFGKNNFVEIARKKAKTDISENEFISISRGFYLSNGEKGWKSSITLPNEKDKLKKISDILKTVEENLLLILSFLFANLKYKNIYP